MEFEIIKKIIVEQIGLNPSELSEDSIFEELGLDSLDVFQLINALEDEFNIDIPMQNIHVETMKDMINFIKDLA